MDVALTLDFLVPQAQYLGVLTANDKASFDALVWTDARPKPAWQAIVDNDAAALAAYRAARPKSRLDRLADLLQAKGAITAAERDGLK